MRICILAVLAVQLGAACGNGPEQDAGIDAADANRDARALEAVSNVCAIPPDADPRVVVAMARPGLGCVRYPFALSDPREVIETRAGAILVTEGLAGRVSRLDANGFSVVASGLAGPIGLREAPDGTLLVAEENTGSLTRVDPATGSRSTLASALGSVTHLTVGPDGNVYVSAFTRFVDPSSVLQLSPSGQLTGFYATGMYVPEGLSFDTDGTLLVANWTSHGGGANGPASVLRVPPGGGSASNASVVAQGFDHVFGIVASPAGVLVGEIFNTTTSGSDRVVRVGTDGSSEPILTGVTVPTGVTIAHNGDVLVLEGVDIQHTAVGYLVRVSGL